MELNHTYIAYFEVEKLNFLIAIEIFNIYVFYGRKCSIKTNQGDLLRIIQVKSSHYLWLIPRFRHLPVDFFLFWLFPFVIGGDLKIFVWLANLMFWLNYYPQRSIAKKLVLKNLWKFFNKQCMCGINTFFKRKIN